MRTIKNKAIKRSHKCEAKNKVVYDAGGYKK